MYGGMPISRSKHSPEEKLQAIMESLVHPQTALISRALQQEEVCCTVQHAFFIFLMIL